MPPTTRTTRPQGSPLGPPVDAQPSLLPATNVNELQPRHDAIHAVTRDQAFVNLDVRWSRLSVAGGQAALLLTVIHEKADLPVAQVVSDLGL